MSDVLKHWWLMPTIRGILAIILAFILFFYPVHTLIFLISFIGAFILVSGIITLIMAIARRPYDLFWRNYAGDGLLGIVIGLLVLFWPAITGFILIYLLAIWALVSGLLQIASGWRLRQHLGNIWLGICMGVLLIILALIAFMHPAAGLATISYVVGFAALVYGLMSLTFGVWLRKKL